jgi:MOSC domain-containing protein YiiM
MSGRVEAIGIAGAAGEPLMPVERVEAVAGRGLVGDRYAGEQGEFSDRSSGMRDVTLIAAEALEALAGSGVELSHLESRRNVLVRGVDVNALVGRRFRLGAIECIGRELSEPCTYLEGLTRPGVLRGLVHRGGLRAGILLGGVLAVGDEVAELPD